MGRFIRIAAGVALASWSLPSSAETPSGSWSQAALAKIAA